MAKTSAARSSASCCAARRAKYRYELAGRADAHRPPWVAWAAAAPAAAVVFGTGGYALGRSTDGARPLASASSSVGGGGAPEPAPATGGDHGLTRDSGPLPAEQGSRSAGSAFFGGRTLFTSKGLSSAAGSASAWGYDPARVFSSTTAKKIAEALGVRGRPRLVDGAWMLGRSDGSGRAVRLEPDGLASFSFYDGSKGAPAVRRSRTRHHQTGRARTRQ